MAELEGQVAIVTGSSRGVGRGTAMAFARAGADVMVAARTDKEGGPLPGTIHQTAEELLREAGITDLSRYASTDPSPILALDPLMPLTASPVRAVTGAMGNL